MSRFHSSLDSLGISEDYQQKRRNNLDSTVMTVGNKNNTRNMEEAGAPIHDYYVLRTPSSTVYYPL